MSYKCPKCGSSKTESCCGGKRIRCDDCGFSAPERIFKSGKLPSQNPKSMDAWPEVDIHASHRRLSKRIIKIYDQ